MLWIIGSSGAGNYAMYATNYCLRKNYYTHFFSSFYSVPSFFLLLLLLFFPFFVVELISITLTPRGALAELINVTLTPVVA